MIWASGEVLANLMFDYEAGGKRILEVGCGIALASLAVAAMLASEKNDGTWVFAQSGQAEGY